MFCSTCKSRFPSMEAFQVHCRELHPEKTGEECTICHEIITLSAFLEHKANCTRAQNRAVLRRRKEKFMKEGGFKCRHCESFFKHELQRIKHEAEEHIGMKFSCEICGKGFPAKFMLKKHTESHNESEEAKVSCHLCGKIVKQGSIKTHITFVHEGKKIISQCKICGEMFQSNPSLLTHYEHYHQEACDYPCKDCGKRFQRKGRLSLHMRSHQEGSFSCNVCGKVSKTKARLVEHERIHTGEKPFK